MAKSSCQSSLCAHNKSFLAVHQFACIRECNGYDFINIPFSKISERLFKRNKMRSLLTLVLALPLVFSALSLAEDSWKGLWVMPKKHPAKIEFGDRKGDGKASLRPYACRL